MRRLLLLLAALTLLALPAAAACADNPQLIAIVGTNDAFTISLSSSSGPVHNLDPGTYTLLVHDRSSFHDFHLVGPGVDVATDIEGTGDQTFTITLVAGTYAFRCDPHQSSMHGSFTVGGAAADVTVTKAAGWVGPGKRIAVSPALAGAKTGVFTLTVADRSRIDNFHLAGPGLSRKTGVASTGTVTWTLTLKPGTYTFRSDAHPSLRGTFTIAS